MFDSFSFLFLFFLHEERGPFLIYNGEAFYETTSGFSTFNKTVFRDGEMVLVKVTRDGATSEDRYYAPYLKFMGLMKVSWNSVGGRDVLLRKILRRLDYI